MKIARFIYLFNYFWLCKNKEHWVFFTEITSSYFDNTIADAFYNKTERFQVQFV